MTDAAKALLAWLDAARSEPVCIDAAWPAYASEGRPKPKRIQAAEELAERGLAVTVPNLPGLWLRYVGTPGMVRVHERTVPEADIDAVLDAVPTAKTRNIHAVAVRAAMSTIRTRLALGRLVLAGKVETVPGRLGAVYRRIDGDRPTSA